MSERTGDKGTEPTPNDTESRFLSLLIECGCTPIVMEHCLRNPILLREFAAKLQKAVRKRGGREGAEKLNAITPRAIYDAGDEIRRSGRTVNPTSIARHLGNFSLFDRLHYPSENLIAIKQRAAFLLNRARRPWPPNFEEIATDPALLVLASTDKQCLELFQQRRDRIGEIRPKHPHLAAVFTDSANTIEDLVQKDDWTDEAKRKLHALITDSRWVDTMNL